MRPLLRRRQDHPVSGKCLFAKLFGNGSNRKPCQQRNSATSQPRLYALTLAVGKGRTYDDDVVFAAAWLHDPGVFTGHSPEDPVSLAQWDHVGYAIDVAPGILRQAGFPEHKIEAVIEAIRTHQPADRPMSLEGAILRDADILEQLGAIGILRTVCNAGRDTRFPAFTAAVQYLQRILMELPGQIEFETTRTLARPKIEALESFLKAVEAEAKPALY